jgi:predicted CoA-binding protein
MTKSVAIIGASHKPQRYAYMAQQLLMEKGYPVFPVSGNGREILDVPGYTGIEEIDQPIDTVTLYVNPVRHLPIFQQIIAARPKRIIFNPGTESTKLEQAYEEQGIETLRACTLVMLRTNQF